MIASITAIVIFFVFSWGLSILDMRLVLLQDSRVPQWRNLRTSKRPDNGIGTGRFQAGTERTMMGWSGRVNSMFSQNTLKFIAIGAAERQLSSIAQNHHVVAAEPWLKFFYSLDINNSRTMDAVEFFGIEFGFDIVHRVAQQVIFSSNVKTQIVSGRFY